MRNKHLMEAVIWGFLNEAVKMRKKVRRIGTWLLLLDPYYSS